MGEECGETKIYKVLVVEGIRSLILSPKLSPGPHKLVVTIGGVGGPIKGVNDVPVRVADTAATTTASVIGGRQAGDHKQQHKSQHGWLFSS